jgi:hypothetical protein
MGRATICQEGQAGGCPARDGIRRRYPTHARWPGRGHMHAGGGHHRGLDGARARVSPLSSSRQVDADPAALARRSGAEMAKLTAGPTAHFRWAPGPFAAAACSGVLRQVVAVCAGPPRVSWPAGRAPRYLSCSSLRRRSRALAH